MRTKDFRREESHHIDVLAIHNRAIFAKVFPLGWVASKKREDAQKKSMLHSSAAISEDVVASTIAGRQQRRGDEPASRFVDNESNQAARDQLLCICIAEKSCNYLSEEGKIGNRRGASLASRINGVIGRYEATANASLSNGTELLQQRLSRTATFGQVSSAACCSNSPAIGGSYSALHPSLNLRRYLSRRELCPSLRGRLSLYEGAYFPSIRSGSRVSSYVVGVQQRQSASSSISGAVDANNLTRKLQWLAHDNFNCSSPIAGASSWGCATGNARTASSPAPCVPFVSGGLSSSLSAIESEFNKRFVKVKSCCCCWPSGSALSPQSSLILDSALPTISDRAQAHSTALIPVVVTTHDARQPGPLPRGN